MTDFARPQDIQAADANSVMPAGSKRLGPDRIRLAPVVVVTEQDRAPLVLSIIEPIEIGRDCRGLTLLDASISRRHLALHPTADGLFIADLGSLNGSTIDGRPLALRHQLVEGEIVRFGGCTLVLARAQPGAPPGAGRTPAVSDDPPAASIRRLADAVLEQGPAISQPDDPGTVTIVFIGIDGSTARSVELGEGKWHDVLTIHNQILLTMLARHCGSEIHSLGDGFMMWFRSARSAVAFVIDAQRALAAYEAANPAAGLRIRAGIHTGEAVLGDGGDLFGTHVVMAAAIADQAQSGEILVSSLVREIIEPHGKTVFGAARKVTLKDLARVCLLHSVVH